MLPIKHWPLSERPRERLLQAGTGALSDAELLALVLQSGVAGSSALEIARELLARFSGLNGLARASRAELATLTGMGPGKIACLEAMRELGRRQLAEEIRSKEVLTNSNQTRHYLRARFGHCEREIFSCLFLDNQHRVIELEELFQGTIDGAAVYPREVVKRCLYYNAAAVIFAHNHPSGVAQPSQADVAITRKLGAALEVIDVRVLDHLVIGSGEVVSMAERSLL